MDQLKEAQNNPFDAPVPGQSMTDNPGNAAWEHPPQYTNTAEAADFVWDQLSTPEFAEQVIAMLDAGIPVEAIARVILFGGFTNGKWTPDVAFIIAEPVMKMIVAVGMQGGVKKFRISMNDMTNNNELKSIMDIKKNSEAFKKATQNITKELPKPEKGGLMAAPQPEQEEAI
jgi:hypothetical protein